MRDQRYSNSWFYGPSYFGETWPNGRPRASQNAVEAVALAQSRAPTATASRSYWSSGGSSTSSFRSGSTSSSSTSVSRGGFGASASSSGG